MTSALKVLWSRELGGSFLRILDLGIKIFVGFCGKGIVSNAEIKGFGIILRSFLVIVILFKII